MDIVDRMLDLRGEGKEWTEVAKIVNQEFQVEKTADACRKMFSRANLQNVTEDNAELRETTVMKPDGSVYRDALIELMEDVPITPDSILSAHGLQPELWQVVSYTNNRWHTQSKLQEHIIQYQSKLSAKPLSNKITFGMIDEYFRTRSSKDFPKLQTAYPVTVKNDTLEICIPDLHSGLLSWGAETGDDYDLHIVRERFFTCISDIQYRCKNRKFKKIYFVTLGDLMHIDNDEQKTTKGTFQQADGRTAKIFENTLDMLIEGIAMLALYAPVEVVYVCGNHDRTTGYMLIKALQMRFYAEVSITFDTSPDPQKFRLIGCSLVGWTHGDMPAKNMRGWLQQRARKEYGLSKHVEIHAGHLHSEKIIEVKQTEESEGMVIRHLPTICSASYWEHQQGYSDSEKTILSFVWNDDKGLRDIWYSNI